MKIFITSIVPALNEEKAILLVIDNILSAFKEFNLSGEIIIINDGSTDSTAQLVERKMKENPNVIRLINHDKPEGIGASFWDGVDMASGDAVVLIPGDNENDPREILRYYRLLDDVDIIIPFVFNKEVRSFSRNLLSFFYLFVVNLTFSVNFNYTNGTILYRKSLLKKIDCRRNDFFFQTDILIRLVKKGYLFAEVPSKLSLRVGGASKATALNSLWRIFKGYLRLIKDYYFKKEKKTKVDLAADSITAARRKAFIN
ncbi:MAG: glycosyltransferase family 2 protein [bacterium]|nr:glycosyltransferase family 2 protein [bacterium]